jgi:uncharacterized repeat protein (TIGR03803 family)
MVRTWREEKGMSTPARASALSVVVLAFGILLMTAPLAASTEEVLYGFGKPVDGAMPYANVVFDKAGNLYGVTIDGGTGNGTGCTQEPYGYGCGTVFELTPGVNGQWSEKILYSFTGGNDGISPVSLIILQDTGALYGVTQGGGTAGYGTVFRLTPGADGKWAEKVLYSFSGSGGAFPQGKLVFDKSGNLYGTTVQGGNSSEYCGGIGCGVVYRLSPGADQWTETVLYSFCSVSECTDGSAPNAGVILGPSGVLYGITPSGGAYTGGEVFQLTPSGNNWTETTLYSFCYQQFCNDGDGPQGQLVRDSSGNLYGVTNGGGVGMGECGCGVVFELTPSESGQWTEDVLYNFCSVKDCADGRAPQAGLTFGPDHDFYGTTPAEVFHLQKSSKGQWSATVLYSSSTGLSSGVTSDSKGNLYAVAPTGGVGAGCENGQSYDCGEAIELVAGSGGTWTPSVLHQFGKGADGLNPVAPLVFDASGNAYGTTADGGVYGDGTVFELTPGKNGTWIETVLFSFNGHDGRLPQAGVILDADGNLYGTTIYGVQDGSACGGYGCGNVFELVRGAKGKWTQKVLHTFSGEDGKWPSASLVFDSSGNLFGTTPKGGLNGYGVVYELSPAGDGSWKTTLVHKFYGSQRDGIAPYSAVTFDSAGNLYGSTYSGGAYNYGTVYQLVPGSNGEWTENVLYAFTGGSTDGGNPYGGVTLDSSGHVYGTSGGSVYELTPVSRGYWPENLVFTFCSGICDHRAVLYSGVIFDESGNLYGTTDSGYGSVYQLTPGSKGWTENVLYTFTGGSDGGNPSAVAFGPDGQLYGTTENYGPNYFGVAFSVAP